jgi:predicted phage tail protein
LLNADGSSNFSGVTWEFRAGTQAQPYIQGMPGSENEISAGGITVSSATPWTRTFTNPQLSAVRLRLKWPSIFRQEDDGDLVGYSINYAIDLQTNGGAFQTVINTSVSGKTTSGYERSHRINLPAGATTWTVRLRKITADANSAKIGDTMTLRVTRRLSMPSFAIPTQHCSISSSTPASLMAQYRRFPANPMRVIRVPDNYDPVTRSYSEHGRVVLSGRGRITRHGYFMIWW